MDIIISSSSQKPLYEQIYEQIVSAIITRELEADESLPSIRKMARELSVSVITTQKTYEKLEANGFIYTLLGKGSFVARREKISIKDKEIIAKDNLCSMVQYFKGIDVSLEEAKRLIEKNWNK